MNLYIYCQFNRVSKLKYFNNYICLALVHTVRNYVTLNYFKKLKLK